MKTDVVHARRTGLLAARQRFVKNQLWQGLLFPAPGVWETVKDGIFIGHHACILVEEFLSFDGIASAIEKVAPSLRTIAATDSNAMIYSTVDTWEVGEFSSGGEGTRASSVTDLDDGQKALRCTYVASEIAPRYVDALRYCLSALITSSNDVFVELITLRTYVTREATS